jgi:hypothetical protein
MNGTQTLECDRRAVRPATSQQRVRAALLAIAGIYTLALAIVASALHRKFGFPLDDSYIHQTVARNLAHYHVLGFTPGVPSSGATSVLWAFIQAANDALLHADPVLFNLFFSWVVLVSIGLLLFRLARRDGMPVFETLLFAIAPALCGNFIWLGLIGMEHLLFVLLVLACIHLWMEEPSRRSVLLTGLFAGLAALTRPEAIILAPALAITGWRRRSAPSIALMLSAWLPCIAALFAANLYTSHSLMPLTLKGREWMYFAPKGGTHSLLSIGTFLLSWITVRQDQFTIFQTNRYLTAFVTAASGVFFVAGAVRLFTRGGSRLRLLFAVTALFFLLFLLTFPTQGHGGRYQPLNLLLLLPCMLFGVVELLQHLFPSRRKTAAVLTGCIALLAGAASLHMWRTITLDGIAHINDTKGATSAWMLRHAPPDARVAVFDIGRFSYDWNGPILDLGGLVDPGYLPFLTQRQVPRYVQQYDASYIILPTDSAAIFGFTADSLREVARFCSPPQAWNIGYFYTSNAWQCQSIYLPAARH